MEKKLKQGPQRGHMRPFGGFQVAVLCHLLCRSIFCLQKIWWIVVFSLLLQQKTKKT